ncbi:MAG TPA: diacylglycerol kinase family protein [Casimicrobiaceae bacterium]|nr:diacylglycerol kinase family protein [Casimicrobiaceae bacterium]
MQQRHTADSQHETGADQRESIGPLFIVLNAASGSSDADAAGRAIRDVLSAASRQHELFVVTDASMLQATAERVAALAQQRAGAVVAAGGDGTINAVAQAVLPTERPFGVIPQGTFNFFGRTHGVPETTEAATRSLVDAVIRPTQIGLVNDHVFNVNASMGLYPELLERREEDKQRLGRSRLVALWSGVKTLLGEHRQYTIELEHHDRNTSSAGTLRTTTLFVGNNALQLEKIGLMQADAPQRGELAALVLKPVGPLGMIGVALRGALGKLGDSRNVHSFSFTRMTVRPWLPYGRHRIKIATDGEIMRMRPPLVFRVSPTPLMLLVPRERNEHDNAR